jgi:hypothetical protein
MPNDAKLGLLAGVAGVVVAAVLFHQAPPAGPAASSGTSQVAATSGGAGPRTAPSASHTASAREMSPSRTRPELAAQPVSRTVSTDDE